MTTPAIRPLPTDILDLVFQHTERTTLKECRLVCVSWYLLTTPYLFHSIQINNTPQIDEFIDFHENPASDQLVPFGKYVRRVTSGEGKGMADKNISLEKLQILSRGYIVDDNIKWKLHRLDQNTENQTFTLDYYYKYKGTIKVIRWPTGVKDFHFVIDFPLLEELALSSTVVIADIQDFMLTCNACSNLTELDLYTNMNDNVRLVAGFAACLSLKALNVKCRSLIPKVLIDYITASLVSLSNVTFWMKITSIQANIGEIYKQLDDFLFTPQKKVASLTLKVQTSYRDDNEQIYTMIDECLNVACRPSKLKACNSIKWIVTGSSMITIDLCKSWNHTIECQISLPSHLFIYLVKRNDFTSSKMPNFHKMCLDVEYRGLPISEIVILFIEKAYNLQELTFCWYSLKNTHGCVYKAVQVLRLENITFCLGFFTTLVMSFPNLKELHLYKVEMRSGAGKCKDKVINLDDLYLEKLSLTTNKRLDSAKIPPVEIICVEIQKRSQYIKVRADRIPKPIANEEGAALWKSSSVNRTYLRMHSAPARFELNNVYIELMI